MTNKINIFSFLLFFILSCAPYSPTTTSSSSTSSSYSVENIEDSIAPKYESGDLKYQPAYSSRKYVMENLNYKDSLEDPLYKTLLTDFYDFIPGVNNATIHLSENQKEKSRFHGALRRRQLSLILAGKMKAEDATELKALFN